MSNLIKGHTIRYVEEFRPLDMNARAEQIENEYMDAVAQGLVARATGFVPFAEAIAGGDIETISQPDDMDEGSLLMNTEFTGMASDTDTSAELAQGMSEELARQITEQQAELDRIREQADLIILDAKEEVKRLLMEAGEEADAIKARAEGEARSIGYAEGIAQAEAEYHDRIEALKAREATIDADYERRVKELEPDFLDFTLKLVRKLTGIYAEERSEIILYLMEETLIEHNKDRDFIIRVSPEDYSVVKEQIGGIKVKLPKDTTIEIVEDKLLHNKDCLIETGTRVFDCSLRMQMNELLEDVRLLGGATDES